VLSNLVCNHTPTSRLSDFANHLYDYRLNWTLFGPFTMIYVPITFEEIVNVMIND